MPDRRYEISRKTKIGFQILLGKKDGTRALPPGWRCNKNRDDDEGFRSTLKAKSAVPEQSTSDGPCFLVKSLSLPLSLSLCVCVSLSCSLSLSLSLSLSFAPTDEDSIKVCLLWCEYTFEHAYARTVALG